MSVVPTFDGAATGGSITDTDRSSKPDPPTEAASRQMAGQRTRDTKPEVLLRKALFRRGLRYRVQVRTLPGRPDIVFTRARIAVFVDGCFWHGCREHGVLPRNNREWWRTKLADTQQRDKRKDRALVELGFLPVHVWEHEHPDGAADRIHQLWMERTTGTASRKI